MLKAVLFDLDGTLVPLNQDQFVETYLTTLAPHVAHLVEPKKFLRQLLASTGAMIADRNPSRTNKEVFMGDFFSHIEVPASKLMPVLDDFYEHHFQHMSGVACPHAAARQSVEAVLEKGLAAVVATNPIFPLTAVRHRMIWGHIADLPFRHITSYETSHFCKPHTEYYAEVADTIGIRPEECLMVGNDVEEDLAAAKIGMKVFLVTDCLLNTRGVIPKPDYSGTLTELAEFLSSGALL